MSEVIIKLNDETLTLSEYNAEFNGYDCDLGSVETKTYKTMHGTNERYINSIFNPHELTVEFIVRKYSNVLALARILTNPIFEFVDDELVYESSINEFEYEYISGDDYLLKLIYNAYIFENRYSNTPIKANTTVNIDSPSPTAINIEVKANETLVNKVITLSYFDFFTNKKYQNDIKIISLINGKTALINSDKFLCFIDENQLYLNNININLYPYTKGKIDVRGIDETLELNIMYRKAY
ncbi:hypothetical protein [Candidatus Stoquefichus sp. SB1]|jgi:hypothetical protein|uniref:Phage tail protein n=1 Tax=Siphoviridae sp. ctQtc11 TaxID=2825497 RepID=A0A8S5P4Y4_9CAUD|nr:hypothetical protein [Candidatus Stoquefichus sp. SB1]DAE01481.1 MAG TPA: hypothetical protein [Siphoviridae sp. ctQtc11]